MSGDGFTERRGGDGGLHPEARALFATLIERVDNIKVTIREHQDEDDKRFDKIEKRIDPLEKGWWKATGAAAVIGAIAAFLGKHFMGGN